MNKRTRVQIECPHIIQSLPFQFPVDLTQDLTTEDEELGTDYRPGMVGTTDGAGTIDRDAGPL
jgi:hypothetical protein